MEGEEGCSDRTVEAHLLSVWKSLKLSATSTSRLEGALSGGLKGMVIRIIRKITNR